MSLLEELEQELIEASQKDLPQAWSVMADYYYDTGDDTIGDICNLLRERRTNPKGVLYFRKIIKNKDDYGKYYFSLNKASNLYIAYKTIESSLGIFDKGDQDQILAILKRCIKNSSIYANVSYDINRIEERVYSSIHGNAVGLVINIENIISGYTTTVYALAYHLRLNYKVTYEIFLDVIDRFNKIHFNMPIYALNRSMINTISLRTKWFNTLEQLM